ncbi:MAG: cysteine--tRNA ligase, partial [Gemmatimonadetes bacterium]|nr:cysteine--tRNA ligase [Gemmatimonadota bacterium]
MRLYDSLRRAAVKFEPRVPGEVTIYGCGPTVYNFAHIGNFRTFLVYDLLHRALIREGYRVRFVVNLTDVDDKTIHGAAEAGEKLEDHTAPFAAAFMDDAASLGFLAFEDHPRATAYIDPMVDFIQRLVDRGHAYRADDGSVYFSVSSFPEYGRLSGNRVESGDTRSRIDQDEYEKGDARDFVLWKATKPVDSEVGAVWQSPWGPGRPGWHLECSVMATGLLGDTVDIHLGGEDLLFPHHENEIAQSQGATGHPFVRFWLHVKHLKLGTEKMSKS